MSKETSLYFLVSTDAKRFKIGIAVDTFRRSTQLTEEINLAESYYVKFSSGREALTAEKSLHFIFHKYKIRNLPSGDGYTEWFSIEILNDAIRILKIMIRNHGIPLSALKKGIKAPKPLNVPIRKLTKSERETRKLAKQIELHKNNIKLNNLFYERVKNLEPFFLMAETDEDGLRFTYYFGQLEKHGGEFFILNEGKSLSIPFGGDNHFHTRNGAFNIISKITYCHNSLVYVHPTPYSTLREYVCGDIVDKDYRECFNAFIDLFSSYSPEYKDF